MIVIDTLPELNELLRLPWGKPASYLAFELYDIKDRSDEGAINRESLASVEVGKRCFEFVWLLGFMGWAYGTDIVNYGSKYRNRNGNRNEITGHHEGVTESVCLDWEPPNFSSRRHCQAATTPPISRRCPSPLSSLFMLSLYIFYTIFTSLRVSLRNKVIPG